MKILSGNIKRERGKWKLKESYVEQRREYCLYMLNLNNHRIWCVEELSEMQRKSREGVVTHKINETQVSLFWKGTKNAEQVKHERKTVCVTDEDTSLCAEETKPFLLTTEVCAMRKSNYLKYQKVYWILNRPASPAIGLFSVHSGL